MGKNQKIVLVTGGLITLALLFVDIYIALIALILVLVLLMSLHIMEDTSNYPFVAAELSEDAREVLITNTGTAEARNIHVALVPFDIEWDITSLGPDEASGFRLESMVSEAKAVVTYENTIGQKCTRTYPLTSLGRGGDPLRPMFPLFRHR
ncbi:MAG TPA: hypothetical protein PKK74_09670 [Candidatus Methanoculleus thermohydrogenotrophicum]|jgi:hypothetical protein|nr:hypothetical protein [Candidatus Methanoculleus thermohydrogenotrophicum]NLM82222.1 hypothetical protein [Candidatus Methanoculleus thermohydrogenotrophicum]HOB18940.1 hypothetical protein [Candidatus Methanoculleus thermohydrogenotrophicum]HPZ38963.1 hypothetical protein [Candidatus Methanoculleus thermohydrogenotrophicum]HQC92079.1 hypothetical protein [Candidatus Methanoculleus thermohydrogenotrophicum]